MRCLELPVGGIACLMVVSHAEQSLLLRAVLAVNPDMQDVPRTCEISALSVSPGSP
jgi:hypothetical protein